MLVTELQDPLHILLRDGIFILKRLWRKNRKAVMYALRYCITVCECLSCIFLDFTWQIMLTRLYLFICKDMTSSYMLIFPVSLENPVNRALPIWEMMLWWGRSKASVSLLRETSAGSEGGNLTNSHYSLISIFFNQHTPWIMECKTLKENDMNPLNQIISRIVHWRILGFIMSLFFFPH